MQGQGIDGERVQFKDEEKNKMTLKSRKKVLEVAIKAPILYAFNFILI